MRNDLQPEDSAGLTLAEQDVCDASIATPAHSIESALEKVLSSEELGQSHRLQQFLRFIVDHTLQNSGEPLKEYLIGLEVFGRKESFDPRLDPIVRVEAGRLRKKLRRYYETEGRSDPVRIELPKRTYTPIFVPVRRNHVTFSQVLSKRVAVGLVFIFGVLVGLVYLREAIRSPSGNGSASQESASYLPNATSLSPLDPAGVAVLPFTDLSPARDQEYFCSGLTEELINALAKVNGLHVVPRTSTFRFTQDGLDIGSVGRQLGVATVLEGGVRKAGDRLRVTIQAVDVAGGYSFWAEKYDGSVADVFAIQTKIAKATVDALKARIHQTLEEPVPRNQTKNIDAFNLYLLGRYHWNKRTEESLFRAVGYFEAALSEDPNYALSYTGLADSYSLLINYGSLPPREAMPKAKAAALKALEADPTLAEAHASLAYVLTYYEWNWREAEEHFRRALELNPNYSDAHQWFSAYLHLMGRHEESARQLEQARKIDPLSVMLNYRIALDLYSDQRYSESIQQCKRTIDLDPDFPLTYRLLGRIFYQQGQYPKAIETLQKGAVLSGREPQYTALIAQIYAHSGRAQMARELLAELLGLAKNRYIFAVDIASVYVSLNEIEPAMRWLEQAYQDRSPRLLGSITNRDFEPLHSDPRFIRLYKKLGLPATAWHPTD